MIKYDWKVQAQPMDALATLWRLDVLRWPRPLLSACEINGLAMTIKDGGVLLIKTITMDLSLQRKLSRHLEGADPNMLTVCAEMIAINQVLKSGANGFLWLRSGDLMY